MTVDWQLPTNRDFTLDHLWEHYKYVIVPLEKHVCMLLYILGDVFQSCWATSICQTKCDWYFKRIEEEKVYKHSAWRFGSRHHISITWGWERRVVSSSEGMSVTETWFFDNHTSYINVIYISLYYKYYSIGTLCRLTYYFLSTLYIVNFLYHSF